MSNFYFTQTQIDIIREEYERAEESDKIRGKFEDAYKKVASMLPSSPVKNWFKGAAEANADQGASLS